VTDAMCHARHPGVRGRGIAHLDAASCRTDQRRAEVEEERNEPPHRPGDEPGEEPVPSAQASVLRRVSEDRAVDQPLDRRAVVRVDHAALEPRSDPGGGLGRHRPQSRRKVANGLAQAGA
jgi:hypothetical protein